MHRTALARGRRLTRCPTDAQTGKQTWELVYQFESYADAERASDELGMFTQNFFGFVDNTTILKDELRKARLELAQLKSLLATDPRATWKK